MSKVGSKGDRSSWRKSKTGAASQAGTVKFGHGGRSRRQLLFRVSALMTLAIGLMLIFLVYLWRRPDHDVPIIFAGVTRSAVWRDRDPLHVVPNPFAKEDADLFARWFDAKQDQHVVFFGTVEEQTGPMKGTVEGSPELIHALTKNLRNVTPGGPAGDTVAMFVTARGIIHEGNPFLLVGNSRPEDPVSWVSLESLLEGVKGALKELSSASKRIRVVLFLDANRGGAIWEWGKYDLSFTKSCKELASRIAPETIAVIASCGENEQSWWDPRRGRSLFARAAAQSMSGHADEDGNGSVTLGEIEAYLRKEVSNQAQRIWDAPQHPELLTESAASWEFIRQPDRITQPETDVLDVKRLADSFATLDSLWSRHDKLAAQQHPPLASMPVAWSVLEKRLARMDLLCMAGSGYDGERGILRASCDKLLGTLEDGSSILPSRTEVPEWRIADYFHDTQEPGLKQDAFDTWKSAAPKDKQPLELGDAEVASLVWPWLVEQEFNQPALDSAKQVVDKAFADRKNQPSYLESHLIRLFTAEDLRKNLQTTADLNVRFNAIASSHQGSRNAHLTKDLRASFWVRDALKKIDRDRMRLVDVALARGDVKETVRKLRSLRYKEVQDFGDLISEAYLLRDRMLHRVPQIAQTLLSDVEAFDQEEGRQPSVVLIQEATDAAACLSATLRFVDAGSPVRKPETLDQAMENARNSYAALLSRLEQRVNVGQAAADERSLRQSVALLHGVGVATARHRKAIHTRLIQLLQQSPSDFEMSASLAAPPASPGRRSTMQAIGNQHVWNYWIQQTGTFQCQRSSDVASNESVSAQGRVVRDQIGDLFRSDWKEAASQPNRLATDGKRVAEVRKDVVDVATKLRARTFLLSHRLRGVEEAIENRFALDLQIFAFEQVSQLLDEFWCEARMSERPFFAKHAERWLRFRSYPDLPPILDGVNLRDRLAAAKEVASSSVTLQPQPIGEFKNGVLSESASHKSVPFEINVPKQMPPGILAIWTEKEYSRLDMMETRQGKLLTKLSLPEEVADESFAVQSFFRGLRRRGGVIFQHLGDSRTTIFRLPDYGAPRVKVQSDEAKAERIVLVLDCSGSMNDRRRLGEARTSILKFLKALNPQKDQVGLVLFGHRFGWLTKRSDSSGKIVLVKDSKRESKYIVKNNTPSIGLGEQRPHNPNLDVEVIASLQLLSDRHSRRLKTALGNAKAVGETPTFLALNIAYDLIGPTPGHIILLTDGKPHLAGVASSMRNSAKQKGATSSSQLTVIKFNDGLSNDELRRSLDLPKMTILAAKEGRLSEVLQSTVATPEVVWLRQREDSSDAVAIGDTATISPWPPLGRDSDGSLIEPAEAFDVQIRKKDANIPLASTRLQVHGGEAFQLRAKDGKLVHLPFPVELHKRLRVEGTDKGKFRVLASLPKRNDNRILSFELVIENRDAESFTPRPQDVWIDLTGMPTDPEATERVRYSVSLAEYVTDQPVPVLRCSVKDWPDWAQRVQVDAWFGLGDPVAPRMKLPSNKGAEIKIDTLDRVQFKIEHKKSDRHQITLTETHQSGSRVGGLRILPYPLPKIAITRVYPKNGIVKRQYTYDEGDVEPHFEVTRREQIVSVATLKASGIVSVNDPGR